VHLREEGFRETRPGQPWPPDRTAQHVLFFFGGSTSFGSNARRLHDPRALGELRAKGCAVDVYNFGRPDYFSTQERILFEQLTNAGQVPDVALFFDGLNDFVHYDGRPAFTDALSDLMERERAPGALGPATVMFLQLPLSRAIATLSRKLSPEGDAPEVPYDDSRSIDQVIRRWTENAPLRAIANEYGVEPLTVVQPVPTYGYDISAHPLAAGISSISAPPCALTGYAELAARAPTAVCPRTASGWRTCSGPPRVALRRLRAL
jgi:hypothetical protein